MMTYKPTSGEEGRMFFEQCEGCEHEIPDTVTFHVCKAGIGDKVMEAKWSAKRTPPTFTADELDASVYPARCLKRRAK
jgi:hypothetical protein